MGIVLSGGTVVTSEACFAVDVRIEGEKIAAVGLQVQKPNDQVVDVRGRFLLPGAVDAHTHFEDIAGTVKTADDFFTGSRAGLLGGTTTFIDFVTPLPGETLQHAFESRRNQALGRSFCDFGFHMTITGWGQSTGSEMEKLVKLGVTSFKLFMAYKNDLQVSDEELFQVFQKTAELGGIAAVHCENGDVIEVLIRQALKAGNTSAAYHALTRPPAVEEEAVNRAVSLAMLAKAPLYIVHLSTREALRVVEQARLRGANVYIETCPQYLLLDDTYYDGSDFAGGKYVLSPPLRAKDHLTALWAGASQGMIDTLSTDHCAFLFKGQKDKGIHDFSKIPNGIPGVEDRLSLLYTYGVMQKKIDLCRMVSLTATKPAEIFGLYPQKGTVAVGSDADIVVWNPAEEGTISAATHHYALDYNPYEGFRKIGQAEQVFLRGEQVVTDGQLSLAAPRGKYLVRKPFANTVYNNERKFEYD